MSVMPGHMTKRPVLKRLDDLSKGDPVTFEQALKDLEALPWNVSAKQLIDFGKTHSLIVSTATNTAEEDHLRDHWFTNWWPQCQPTPPLIRRGLLKAFDLSIDRKVPLDCYWCCAGHDFEVVVLLSKQQVTTIITTPPPPGQHPTDFPHDEDIWMVKTAKPGDGEHVESDADGIYTVQLKTDNRLP